MNIDSSQRGSSLDDQDDIELLSTDELSPSQTTIPCDTFPHSSSSNESYNKSGDFANEQHPQEQYSEIHSTRKLMQKPIKDKTCLVCGDKALGYNFNAISCESCKAFFRRNAYKEIRGRCEGRCDVTTESRSYCKKCRLAKCFRVGMKKDLILNDQQKAQRRSKISENRMRRMGVPCPTTPESLHRSTSKEHYFSPSTAASSGGSDKSDTGSNSSFQDIPPHIPGGAPIKEEASGATETHALASEVGEDVFIGLSSNVVEKIRDVMHAFEISFDGPVDKASTTTPSGAEFLNMADTSVRRLVKMAKHLGPFKSLEQEDQILLLKGAVVEVLILRSAKLFDTSTMGWSVTRGQAAQNISAASLQFGSQESMEFFAQYSRFATSLLNCIQKDNVIVMLMIVIAVLSPDRANTHAKETVAAAQEEYSNILHEYIKVRYPADPLVFAKVMQKLADIRNLNETHTKMLMHMKVEDLEPLVVEIFDLSS